MLCQQHKDLLNNCSIGFFFSPSRILFLCLKKMFDVPLSVPEATSLGVFRGDGHLNYCQASVYDTVDTKVCDRTARRWSTCLLKITAL